MENHHHFACVKYIRVVEFYHKPFENIQVAAGMAEKFKVLRKTVYLEGMCDQCQKNTGE